MTTEEITNKLNKIRSEYKKTPTKMLLIQGKLLRYALDLRLKDTSEQLTV